MNFKIIPNDAPNGDKFIFFSVDVLNQQTVRAVILDLITNLPTITPEPYGGMGWAEVTINIEDGSNISEKVLWSIAFDICSDAPELTSAYIEALSNDLALKGDSSSSVFYTSPVYQAGELAIYAWIDHFKHRQELQGSFNKDQLLNIYNCFYKWLSICDLDIEVYQDTYINLMLRYTKSYLSEQHNELLFFRLFNGQDSLTSKNSDYLYLNLRTTGLKKFIDYLIAQVNDKDDLYIKEFHIYYILSSIYGSAQVCIRDVVKYVFKQTDGKIPSTAKGSPLWKSVERIQKQTDDQKTLRLKRAVSTGFHLYDPKEEKWSSLEI